MYSYQQVTNEHASAISGDDLLCKIWQVGKECGCTFALEGHSAVDPFKGSAFRLQPSHSDMVKPTHDVILFQCRQ